MQRLYILSLAVSIPISGCMAERYGTRRIFTLLPLLYGLAANSTMLMPVGHMTA